MSLPTSIPGILEQHADQAAGLWLQRRHAVRGKMFSLMQLLHLDRRVDAHIQGLALAGAAGWERCRRPLFNSFIDPDAGEVFAAAAVAVRTGNEEAIEAVQERASGSPELEEAFISAIAWSPTPLALKISAMLAQSHEHARRRIGITVFAVRRADPGAAFIAAMQDENLAVRARALRLVGELGRADLLSYLGDSSFGAMCKFWASWSRLLLRDNAADCEELMAVAQSGQLQSEVAASLALRRLEPMSAVRWLERLGEQKGQARLAAIGAGEVGDPFLVPMLTQYMRDPALARISADAFSAITGVDLAKEHLDATASELSAAPDPDRGLPWPNVPAVDKWWTDNNQNFENGKRYVLGHLMTEDWLEQVLMQGTQARRRAAALELAVRRESQPLFNVCGPAFQQQQLLGSR